MFGWEFFAEKILGLCFPSQNLVTSFWCFVESRGQLQFNHFLDFLQRWRPCLGPACGWWRCLQSLPSFYGEWMFIPCFSPCRSPNYGNFIKGNLTHPQDFVMAGFWTMDESSNHSPKPKEQVYWMVQTPESRLSPNQGREEVPVKYDLWSFFEQKNKHQKHSKAMLGTGILLDGHPKGIWRCGAFRSHGSPNHPNLIWPFH